MLNTYTLRKCQKNNIVGWEVCFHGDDVWGVSLGFFKTKKEAKLAIDLHKRITK